MSNREKFDTILNNVINGNHTESRKQIKNLAKCDRYDLIVYLKSINHNEIAENIMKMCVTGDFN